MAGDLMNETLQVAGQSVVCWLVVFIAMEIFAGFAFGFIRAIHERKKLQNAYGDRATQEIRKPVFSPGFDLNWLKGILERMVISIGLLSGYVHVLTFFGALKIATGLNSRAMDKDDPGHAWNMDYFLIGNLVSALLAILTVLIIRTVQPLIFVTS